MLMLYAKNWASLRLWKYPAICQLIMYRYSRTVHLLFLYVCFFVWFVFSLLGLFASVMLILCFHCHNLQVFLNNVQCTGSEAKLSDCTASYDTLYASNTKTAGVVCQNIRMVAGGKIYRN